jgi:hypothetical protein
MTPTIRWAGSLLLQCATILGWGAVAAKAQPFVLSRATDQPASGFRLYSITGYASYGSLLPVLYGNQPQSGVSSKIEGGGSAALGWSASGPTTNLSLTFAPSFVSRPGVDTAYSLNSGLNLDTSMSTRLSPKWSLRFSVLGRFNDLEQSLFLPSSLTTIAEVPSNSQDWATALSAGKYAANSPITSLVTAAPVVDSPARTILYGDRILTVGLGTGWVYTVSPRLTIAASVNATRTQSVPFDTSNNIPRPSALLSQSTSGSGEIGLSYALSPRSSVSIAASSTRSMSKYQDAYVTTATASFSRLLSQQWFISVNGGAGYLTSIRQTSGLPTGVQYTAGGSLGFKTTAHALVASYAHTISDPYGLGAQNGQITSGSWTWARPRAKWYLQASGTRQSFDPGGIIKDLNGWIGQAALGRSLARDFSLNIQYAYLDNHGAIRNSNVSHTVIGQSVRVSLTWTPVRTPWFIR